MSDALQKIFSYEDCILAKINWALGEKRFRFLATAVFNDTFPHALLNISFL